MKEEDWENEVHIVVEQQGNGIPVYEVGPESGANKQRVLHRNLLLPCTYLPVDEPNLQVSKTPQSGRRQHKPINAPKKKQSFDQDSCLASQDEDNSNDDIPSIVPSQLQRCAQTSTSEHSPAEPSDNQDTLVIVTITIHSRMSSCRLMIMHQPGVSMRLLREPTSRSSPRSREPMALRNIGHKGTGELLFV